jgi:hypothetical protein
MRFVETEQLRHFFSWNCLELRKIMSKRGMCSLLAGRKLSSVFSLGALLSPQKTKFNLGLKGIFHYQEYIQ